MPTLGGGDLVIVTLFLSLHNMAASLKSTLELWKLLILGDASPEACQNDLLALLPASSLIFDADPSATSADVDHLEGCKSLLLAALSPVAKAMSGNHHVGVASVSVDELCMGIFNCKEVKARRDPVVRACGLLLKGKGACTNTSHQKQHLSFEGRHVMICTPTVSKSTAPACLSAPYLKLESLPKGSVEALNSLHAPINVRRTVFMNTLVALPSVWKLAHPTGLQKPLAVATEFNLDTYQAVMDAILW